MRHSYPDMISCGIIPGSLSLIPFLMVTRSSAWFFASPSCRDKAGNIEDVVYVEGNRILPRLAEILEKEKDNIKTIAVQADQMTVAELEQLQKTVPCRVMADGRLDEILYQQSCRKTAEEIQAVQDAQDAADKMFTEVLNYVHAGMDDMELQKIVGVLLPDFGPGSLPRSEEREGYDYPDVFRDRKTSG